MIIFKLTKDLTAYRQKKLSYKNITGFIPTMGALHHGHISLIKKSKQFSDVTICSIFINPTQFNDDDDFKKYPITLENDIYLLEKSGCDVLFLPNVEEIYPDGITFKEEFELGFIEKILEGEHRPGHFQGVCQVINRLLKIVKPDKIYLGQKDYQQCMVLRKLITLTDLKIELEICATLREKDGVAMSSRNLRLNEEERKIAPEIYKTLIFIKENILPGNLAQIKRNARQNLEKKKFKVDYVEIADARTLQLKDEWNGTDPVIILAAAFINNVRLIDNILI